MEGKIRPVIVVQNDIGNYHSSVTNVIALTSFRSDKKRLPTHVIINPSKENGLMNKSIALVEQIRTIPIDRLMGDQIGTLEDYYWTLFYQAALNQFPFLKTGGDKFEKQREQSRVNYAYRKENIEWIAQIAN